MRHSLHSLHTKNIEDRSNHHFLVIHTLQHINIIHAQRKHTHKKNQIIYELPQFKHINDVTTFDITADELCRTVMALSGPYTTQ